MIVNAGITRLVYRGVYPDEFSLGVLREAGVEIVNFPALTGEGQG